MKPPVRGVEEFREVRGEAHTASPAVLTICERVIPCSRMVLGSTITWSCRSRCPQIATLATPGTPSSRGTIVQRERTDGSIGDTGLELSPMYRSRPGDG